MQSLDANDIAVLYPTHNKHHFTHNKEVQLSPTTLYAIPIKPKNSQPVCCIWQ